LPSPSCTCVPKKKKVTGVRLSARRN
jgi:hypothetical protein